MSRKRVFGQGDRYHAYASPVTPMQANAEAETRAEIARLQREGVLPPSRNGVAITIRPDGILREAMMRQRARLARALTKALRDEAKRMMRAVGRA